MKFRRAAPILCWIYLGGFRDVSRFNRRFVKLLGKRTFGEVLREEPITIAQLEWLAKEVALVLITTLLFKKAKLQFRRHALGDYRHAEIMGERHDRGRNHAVIFFWNIFDELAVDL